MIGRIYKIIVSCSNEIYIGSTFNELRFRWAGHKQEYKNWKGGITNKTSSFELFEKWGIENCKIFLIKEYEVVDKKHLEMYEQIWINKLRPINKYNPFFIGRFYHRDRYQKQLQQNPDFNKDRYQKALEKNPNFHKELYQKQLERNPNYFKEKYQKQLERNPNYYKDKYQKELELHPNLSKEHYQKALERNPNHNKERYQKALEKNPDYCKEQYQKKLQKNPNLNKEKIICECGLEVNKKNHSKHKRSKKHTNRMS